MAQDPRQRALRIAVIADGQVIEELHQTRPGHLDVGRGGPNDVHVYDAHLRPRDRRKHAPIWLGLGVLMVVVGFGVFARELSKAAAAADENSFFASGDDGFDIALWAAGLLFIGLAPLISGFTALREAPPPRVPEPRRDERPAPDSHRLFRYDDNAGVYELDLPGHVGGRLVLGKKKASVAALRKSSGDSSGRVRVQLPSNSKGELRLGDSILLFKLTRPARGGPLLAFPTAFIDRWQYVRLTPLDLAVQLSAFLLLGGFFAYLATAEATEPEVSTRFADAMGIVKYEPQPEEPEVEEEPEEEEEDVLEQKDEKQPTEEIVDTKVLKDKPTNFSEKAMQKARGVGVARALGTYGGEGEGTVIDVIQSTENNLGELFAMGMTQTVNADSADVSAFVAGGEGISAHGAMVQTQGLITDGGPADVGTTEKRERKVKTKVNASGEEVYGDVDKKMVKAIIRRRMAGLKACYDRALQSRPDLTGRMSFTIEIAVVGRVTRVDIEQDTVGDPGVKGCVTAKIRSWRFPVEDAEEPSEVSFSVVFEGGS